MLDLVPVLYSFISFALKNYQIKTKTKLLLGNKCEFAFLKFRQLKKFCISLLSEP